MTPLGGFCAVTLISLRLPDKAPEKITNKPQITASVVLLLDRRVCVSLVCVCVGASALGVEEAQVHLQDVVQPEEPSDTLKKNKCLKPGAWMTSSAPDDSRTELRLASNFSFAVTHA